MNLRVAVSLLYALHLVWTGLWRNIEAQAYKPNALWFCLVMATLVVGGSYCLQLGRERLGQLVGGGTTALVFGFYLFSLISNPTDDASYRVGLIILTSVAHASVLFLPHRKG